jgi:DNA-binding response OmpR family regulator
MLETHGSLILVVDDDAAVRELCRAVLTSAGFAVLTAESAEECERMLTAMRPDLVLMDRGLGGADGYELTRRIKSAGNSDLLVLAFSTSATRSADAVAIDAGCDGFVPKPFTPAELIRAVRWHLMARRRASDSGVLGHSDGYRSPDPHAPGADARHPSFAAA